MTKRSLREQFLQKRKMLSNERRQEACEKACAYLEQYLKPFQLVLSFASKEDEINLWPLNERLVKENRLVLPKVKQQQLELFRITELKNLVKTNWKILEPDLSSELISLEQIDCILVPAIAFDPIHHRLGFGKGHYDRLLSKQSSILTIGIGFKEQFMSEWLPVEEHDQPVQELLLF